MLPDFGPAKPVILIDGARFDTLEGFFAEIGRQVIPGRDWGENLDAFNDILRGGFGTPPGGFVLLWKDHARSQADLGHVETARQFHLMLPLVDPENFDFFEAKLTAALCGVGPTIFDLIVEIIQIHGPDGPESQDGVDLRLC